MKHKKSLGSFALAMISVAAIINLRNAPLMAKEGYTAIFFYLAAALLFLIPSGLVCAQLASRSNEPGGVYIWVRHAFGDKLGFFAIWSEWINNVIAFPASLSFIAATIAYLFLPQLANDKTYMFIVMMAMLWGGTLFCFLGVKASSKLNTIGALCGTIIPGCFIVVLALWWLLTKHSVAISPTYRHFLPPMHVGQFVFFAGVITGYSGMQITAFHAPNVQNPKRDFPLSILWATIIIFLVTVMVSLSIAVVVPTQNINLVSGLMNGFYRFFHVFHITWFVPILALLIAVGGFSSLCAWLLGPARGIQAAADDKLFPKILSKQNKKEMPVSVLVLQGLIATAFACVFLLMPNISTAFWILMALTSQFTAITFIMVFAAAFKLYDADARHGFKIPLGRFGTGFICTLGILACIATSLVGFFPPAQLAIGNVWLYESILVGCGLLYLLVPIIIFKMNSLIKQDVLTN